MKILAMDDSPVMHKIISLMLGGLPGATLDLAFDVKQALEKVQSQIATGKPYQLVLSDLNCPGLDAHAPTRDLGGLQLIALLRRDDRQEGLIPHIQRVPFSYFTVPIILFTTDTNPHLLQLARGDGQPKKGANEVLNKNTYLAAGAKQAFLGVLGNYLQPAQPAAASAAG